MAGESEGLNLSNGQEVSQQTRRIDTFITILGRLEEQFQAGDLTRDEVIRKTAEMLASANEDKLTGLMLRDFFDLEAERKIAEAQRENDNLVIIYGDLNSLHEINEKYLHIIGDHLLMATGQAINNRKRDSDLAARYGGDEFVILCKHVEVEAVPALVSDFQDAIVSNLRGFTEDFGMPEEDARKVGISLGFTIITKEEIAQLPKDPTPIERQARRRDLLREAIDKADEAMMGRKKEEKANRTS